MRCSTTKSIVCKRRKVTEMGWLENMLEQTFPLGPWERYTKGCIQEPARFVCPEPAAGNFRLAKVFKAELARLRKEFIGGPTPIYHAKRLTDFCGGAQTLGVRTANGMCPAVTTEAQYLAMFRFAMSKPMGSHFGVGESTTHLSLF